MEKLKTIKTIIWIVCVLFFMQLGMFTFALRPITTYMWLSVAVLAILIVYLVRVSLMLVKELKAKGGLDE